MTLNFHQIVWFLLTLIVLGCDSSVEKEVMDKRPNILWITTEDISPHLPSFGDSTVETHKIDRLTREGVMYTNFYTVYGVCAPSRAAIITGMYPTTIGAMHMRTMKRTAAIDLIDD